MIYLLFAGLLLLAAFTIPLLHSNRLNRLLIPSLFGLSAFVAVAGGVQYNDAGYCVHIRTIFGTESNKCTLGWYFSGWGNVDHWPHYITIKHDALAEDGDGSSINPPYMIRMSDNWTGVVTQTTRFGIPHDTEQFLKMAHALRTPDRLITTTLRPAVTSSLDSVANLFTMEEYYAGGRRDDFKNEFRDSIILGRAMVKRVERVETGPELQRDTAPSDSPVVDDTADVGGADRIRFYTEKILGADGQPIRIPNGFQEYGITVSTAILEQLDPDDRFEEQIQARKDAAARRAVAVEKRLEEEQQRLLAIAKGEREIAERQAEARKKQIEQTTNAETEKRLALISSEKDREQARIAKVTAEINLERARLDAEARKVSADAAAYEKNAILLADGALAQKLEAWVTSQRFWADAFAQRKVPTQVFGASNTGTGSDLDVSAFMQLMTAQAARSLAFDPVIQSPAAGIEQR